VHCCNAAAELGKGGTRELLDQEHFVVGPKHGSNHVKIAKMRKIEM
jgi:hypothetical protein